MSPVKEKIYWHPAKEFRIGNYVKEVRSRGEVDQSEEELIFHDHIFTATVAREIKHIEKSRSFKNGQIQLCDSIRQAASLTNAHNRRKVATMSDNVADPVAPVDEKVTDSVSATG